MQDKSRFVVAAFGDSKTIYDVKGLYFPWFCQILKVLSQCGLQSLRCEGRIHSFGKKIETEVVKNWIF